MNCVFSSDTYCRFKFHFSFKEIVQDYKQNIWSAFLFLSQKLLLLIISVLGRLSKKSRKIYSRAIRFSH